MDTQSTNRVTMFKTVSRYLDQKQLIWNTMTPLQTAVTTFNDRINDIYAAAQKQETPSGAATDKASARDDLEDVLFLTSEALSVLAHNNRDEDLAALTDLTPSGLDRMTDEQLSNRAMQILTIADARKTELATLHVTQANLDELNTALADFNAAKNEPRRSTVERKTQTESLAELIRGASGILRNQIDPMVNLFSRSQPDFVANYRGARVIVDRAATHKAVKPPAGPPP